jgi:hypothetical protein
LKLAKSFIKILLEIFNLFIKKLLFLAVIGSSIFFYSCSDDPSSIGADLLKNDYVNINSLDSFKDTLSQSSYSLKRTFELGASDILLVGKSENVEASTLMRFFISLSDSMKQTLQNDSLNILGAKITIIRSYRFGDENAPFDFTVHKILSGWTSQHFTADSLPMLSYEQEDLSSNKSFSDSVNTFDISNDIVLSWLKYSIDSTGNASNGIYIQPTSGSNKVNGYNALYLGSTVEPTLTVAVEKPGVYIDTLTYILDSDVSVVTGNMPSVNQLDLVLQSGLAVNTKLWFDISKIPADAIINNAEVTLNLDTTKTIIGDGSTNTILGAFVEDSSAIVLDSSASIVTFSRTDNYYTGTITSYVQRWLNTKINEGLLLFTRDQIRSVDIFALLGSEAADLSLRPKLHIVYSTKK